MDGNSNDKPTAMRAIMVDGQKPMLDNSTDKDQINTIINSWRPVQRSDGPTPTAHPFHHTLSVMLINPGSEQCGVDRHIVLIKNYINLMR